MALSDIFSGDTNWGDLATGLAGLYGNYQSYNNALNANNQISGALGGMGTNIAGLQGQLGQNQALAQQAYQAARGNVDTQNAGLERDIGTMTSNLSALSDPNSPYMQMARQALERKDAAAGRRSQWGDREVQLAAQLADYVGKYSPGMQSAITNARNQISQNNMGLANIFGTMNNPASSGQTALQQMLQQRMAGANGAGREAGNRVNSNLSNLIGSGVKGLGGLAGLFGGGGGNGGILGGLFQDGAYSGFGDGSLFGNSFAPLGDYGVDTSGLGGYGYGNLPMGDYFGGGGIGGVPTAWDGGLSDDSLWD